MKRFALIGAAGYVAPRHLKAIKETGNELIAALDPSDSVGVLDSYFPDAAFFTQFERFDRFLEMQRRSGNPVDYVSICSPNDLHDAHIRFALRLGAHAICEKPVVINPWNIDPLKELAEEHGKSINVVLQLRLHPAIRALRERLKEGHHTVSLRYVTPRGLWYDYSWKGLTTRSGGIATNIGVHLFDLLLWLFGPKFEVGVVETSTRRLSGKLNLERATVDWLLSISKEDLLPGDGGRNRSMVIDGEIVNFTTGFENLHTEVYREVLDSRGFSLDDARPAIELTARIREMMKQETA